MPAKEGNATSSGITYTAVHAHVDPRCVPRLFLTNPPYNNPTDIVFSLCGKYQSFTRFHRGSDTEARRETTVISSLPLRMQRGTRGTCTLHRYRRFIARPWNHVRLTRRVLQSSQLSQPNQYNFENAEESLEEERADSESTVGCHRTLLQVHR